MSTSSLTISLENTFLDFSETPRPTFRRAHTSASLVKGSDSPCSWASTRCSSFASSMDSPSNSSPKTKVLDTYVASVGDCLQTTVMVRGIPKSYDQETLLAEIETTGLPVNFLYLPPGKSKSNRSYGFVNFETETAAAEFLHKFEGYHWRQASVSKLANVGYATLQGFDQNVEFFSKQEVAQGVSKRSHLVKH